MTTGDVRSHAQRDERRTQRERTAPFGRSYATILPSFLPTVLPAIRTRTSNSTSVTNVEKRSTRAPARWPKIIPTREDHPMSEPVTGPAAPAAVRPGEAEAVEGALRMQDNRVHRQARAEVAEIVAAAYGPIAEAVRVDEREQTQAELARISDELLAKRDSNREDDADHGPWNLGARIAWEDAARIVRAAAARLARRTP